jgi:pimeloyl-ACP methyl ester carboxylesterase
MAPRARQVPAIIIQGDADPIVPPPYAERLVTHWAAIDDLVVDGQIDGDVDDKFETRQRVVNPAIIRTSSRSTPPRKTRNRSSRST